MTKREQALKMANRAAMNVVNNTERRSTRFPSDRDVELASDILRTCIMALYANPSAPVAWDARYEALRHYDLKVAQYKVALANNYHGEREHYYTTDDRRTVQFADAIAETGSTFRQAVTARINREHNKGTTQQRHTVY